jgi:uncharacterized RDD family membrane protein YckC
MSQTDPNPYASPSMAAEAQPPVGPIQGTIDYPLASRWRRFLGALIDNLILLPLIVLAGFVFALVIFLTGEQDQTSIAWSQSNVADSLFGLVMGGSLFLAVHGYLLATRGQTVGKYLLNTQIVSEDGRLVPFWQLIATRYVPLWLVSAIPGIGGILSIADGVAIFRDSRKCFHDDIAGTKVIQL